MKRVNREGGIPPFMKVFLTNQLPGEEMGTQVYSCTHEEIINLAKSEQLEPQVLIDKTSGSGKSYIAAVGAKERSILDINLYPSPVFYFAELTESQRKMYTVDLQKARDTVNKNARLEKEKTKILREERRMEDV